ncbi:DUF771 domain-containing protein [Staphylococcus arlettae]
MIAHHPNKKFNYWRFNARKIPQYINEHFEEILG